MLFEAPPVHQLLQPQLASNVFIVAVAITTLTVCELRLVQLTSAVAMNILSAIHGIPLVLVGMLVRGEHVSPVAACGYALCLAGTVTYFNSRQSPQKAVTAKNLGTSRER